MPLSIGTLFEMVPSSLTDAISVSFEAVSVVQDNNFQDLN